MAGLFTLLYATIWGTSKIVSTIMDENSKSKSKAEAIQKGITDTVELPCVVQRETVFEEEPVQDFTEDV